MSIVHMDRMSSKFKNMLHSTQIQQQIPKGVYEEFDAKMQDVEFVGEDRENCILLTVLIILGIAKIDNGIGLKQIRHNVLVQAHKVVPSLQIKNRPKNHDVRRMCRYA